MRLSCPTLAMWIVGDGPRQTVVTETQTVLSVLRNRHGSIKQFVQDQRGSPGCLLVTGLVTSIQEALNFTNTVKTLVTCEEASNGYKCVFS